MLLQQLFSEHPVIHFLQVTPTGNPVLSKNGRNALVTSLIVCCGLFACWSMNNLVYFVNFVGYPIDFGGWLYHFTVVLVFTNSCINPFIYAAKYRRFQEGVRAMIRKIRPGQQESQFAGSI